jgi:hypothetical protein
VRGAEVAGAQNTQTVRHKLPFDGRVNAPILPVPSLPFRDG